MNATAAPQDPPGRESLAIWTPAQRRPSSRMASSSARASKSFGLPAARFMGISAPIVAQRHAPRHVHEPYGFGWDADVRRDARHWTVAV